MNSVWTSTDLGSSVVLKQSNQIINLSVVHLPDLNRQMFSRVAALHNSFPALANQKAPTSHRAAPFIIKMMLTCEARYDLWFVYLALRLSNIILLCEDSLSLLFKWLNHTLIL